MAAHKHETIFVSGGKRGLEIEIAPDALITVLNAVVGESRSRADP